MSSVIRLYEPSDEQAIVELALRAWVPVHDSMREVMGEEIFDLLHGDDWRALQEHDVRSALAHARVRVWVAEDRGHVVGFVSALLDRQPGVGEITLLAVDPDYQRDGVGTALAEAATRWLGESGMRVAMVTTGGDPGHAAARRMYEKSGYTLMPVARYYRAL